MRSVVSKSALAQRYGLSAAALTEWEEKARFPRAFFDVDAQCDVYDLAEVNAWLELAEKLIARAETRDLLGRLRSTRT